ncbi:MAG: histidine kinase [Reichenbachiella sp.]
MFEVKEGNLLVVLPLKYLLVFLKNLLLKTKEIFIIIWVRAPLSFNVQMTIKRGLLFILIFIGSIIELVGQENRSLDSLNQLSKNYVCIDKNKFDSLSYLIIDQAKLENQQSQWAYAVTLRAHGEICQGNMREALTILSEARHLYDMAADPEGMCKALSYTVKCHASLSQIDSALIYSNQQIKLAKSTFDTLIIASAYLSRSTIHTKLAQNDSVIFYAVNGLKILGNIVDSELRGSFNISIGNAYYQNEEYKQAANYFTQAINFVSEESMGAGSIYHNLGAVFTKLEMYDSSFYYLDKTIVINKRLNRKYFLAFNYQALAENYNKAGDCRKSIEYNLLAMSMSEEVGEKRSYAGALVNITACYIKLSQLAKAIASSRRAIIITQEIGDTKTEANAHFVLSEAYGAAGKYELAYEAHKRFYSIDSMLLGLDKRSAIAEIETKYETEKKETEIATLSQQSIIQSLELQQKNQIILIGLLVIGIATIATYFFLKHRSLKNKESRSEIEQRFLRSQLNPHFISNALVAVQNFMLKNQSEKAALYLAKFSKLMREILENSRQEYILVEDEVTMLQNYLDIHKMRMNDSFDYNIKVDESIDPETDTIPPMFVQPFVENAIEHGLTGLKERGNIQLSFVKKNDFVSIQIIDNGKGFGQSHSTSTNHNSLSTSIIKERMEIFNRSLKDKIALVISEVSNEEKEVKGTRVELKVPFSYI